LRRPEKSAIICETWAFQAAVIPVPLCGRNPLGKFSEMRCRRTGFLPQSGTGMTGVPKGIPCQMTALPSSPVKFSNAALFGRRLFLLLRPIESAPCGKPGVSHIPRWTQRSHLCPLPLSRGERDGIGSLPSPKGLSVSHVFCWTPGGAWFQPQRGELSRPAGPGQRPGSGIPSHSRLASPEGA